MILLVSMLRDYASALTLRNNMKSVMKLSSPHLNASSSSTVWWHIVSDEPRGMGLANADSNQIPSKNI